MTVSVPAGWIGRHTPRNARAGGRDAAIIDVAQDLLLGDLPDRRELGICACGRGGSVLERAPLFGGHRQSADERVCQGAERVDDGAYDAHVVGDSPEAEGGPADSCST
jgi:hypothetical protein